METQTVFTSHPYGLPLTGWPRRLLTDRTYLKDDEEIYDRRASYGPVAKIKVRNAAPTVPVDVFAQKDTIIQQTWTEDLMP